ncbi:TonB-dependent receptor [Mesoterricola sediminis]|uniref:Membrane protein n=1 Tax=Mesoterricola sediminis TaxID=2927980 RepID=A0AA48GTS4_9BACT|nr:carboxypeptidase regulatory-like domain-containing protein [Mesoterricola sediminis]BDU76049.1 membrane protein [Mesoterricola sediminis]
MSNLLRTRSGSIPALAVLLAAAAMPAVLQAQTTNAVLRGRVRAKDGRAIPGAVVMAVNKANGYSTSTVVRPDGTYFLSLDPATYNLTVTAQGQARAAKTIRVQVGQALDLDFNLAPMAEASATVEVTGTLSEIRTAEVATNITTEQLESLPQGNRNFLNYAALAPGIKISNDEMNQSFSSGGQTNQRTNIFIDGASYKSDLLSGGSVGQDSSRGNPFPLTAVQEFRVLTENYKAEYQKASGAVITAVTKSGTNEFHGDMFTYYQNKNLVANNWFAAHRGQPNPEYSRTQYGLSVGGPILKDRMHFFLSYEGQNQNRDNLVYLGGTSMAGASQALKDKLNSYAGSYPSPFRSDLVFGKVDYQINPQQILEWTINWRNEHEKRDFGAQTSYERGTDMANNVLTSTLKHKFTTASWVNEAMVSFQRAEWNPKPLHSDLVGKDYQGIIVIGGNETTQDFVQKRTSLRDDFTYLGVSGHTIKTGLTLDFLDYKVQKWQVGNPVYRFNTSYDPTLTIPFQAQYGVGNPDMSADNKQFGIYVQDDWNVTPRLQVNLGVRWDYESHMFNEDYVTPANVVSTLSSLYPSNYFSDGSQRKPYYGAFQPRIGFTYDVKGNNTLVVFGGVGRYYDRESFNNVLDERFRLQWGVRTFTFSADGSPVNGTPAIKWDPSYLTKAGLDTLIAKGVAPNPEVFLLDNNAKPAYSDQVSLGARGVLGAWNWSVTLTDVESKNSLTWKWGNRDANLNYISVPGFSNVLLSDTKKTWYQAMYVTFEKPYSEASGWGFGVRYTLSSAKQTGNDLFSLDYVNADAYGKHPTADDERNRLIFDGIVKLPWGFKLSGLITLSTGLPYTIWDVTNGWDYSKRHFQYNAGRPIKYSFIIPNAWGYRSVDLKLQKDFKIGKAKLGVNAECINVFNYNNWIYGWDSGYIDGSDGAKARFGQPVDVLRGRRVQFGATLQF